MAFSYYYDRSIEYNLTRMWCYKMVTESLLASRKNNIVDNNFKKDEAKRNQWNKSFHVKIHFVR